MKTTIAAFVASAALLGCENRPQPRFAGTYEVRLVRHEQEFLKDAPGKPIPRELVIDRDQGRLVMKDRRGNVLLVASCLVGEPLGLSSIDIAVTDEPMPVAVFGKVGDRLEGYYHTWPSGGSIMLAPPGSPRERSLENGRNVYISIRRKPV